MAVVIEAVEAEVVEADKAKEVAIKAGANIKIKDIVVELEEEEVTIALIIDYYY
jgi:hypothetical protein